MRRILIFESGAYLTQGATAPMRRIRIGVIGDIGGAKPRHIKQGRKRNMKQEQPSPQDSIARAREIERTMI